MKRVLNIAFPLFVFMLLSASVRAESVVITGGGVGTSVFLGQFRGGGGSVSGEGFEISYVLNDSVRTQVTGTCVVAACAPGTVVPAGGSITMGSNIALASYAVIDGVRYQPVITAGGFTFTAGDVVIPVATLDTLTLTTAFTMTGRGIVFVPPTPSTPIFDVEWSGQGTAFLTFIRSGDGYLLRSIGYQFGESPAGAVPEPATVLLLGTGLAGVAARLRRRRRAAAVTGS